MRNGMWIGMSCVVSVGVCVVVSVCTGVCVGVSACVFGVISGVCVLECVCGVRSWEGVLRLSSILQSASFGGEITCGCSLSEGGWMEIHGGLSFFFLWPPPTDCTLTGNPRPPLSDNNPASLNARSSTATTAWGRQISMEWRRWSSG